MTHPSHHLTRRQTLKAAGVAVGAAVLPAAFASPAVAATGATLTPELTEGPYWVNTMLRRSNVRANTDGTHRQAGVPLDLYINVRTRDGKAINDVAVDIWHANADGIYSDESSQSSGGGVSGTAEDTISDNFLRGYQITGQDKGLADDPVDGQVSFHTIWPGWYTGRAIHIHVRVRKLDVSGETVAGYTTQIVFTDADNDRVLERAAPYNTRSPQTDPTTDETDTVVPESDDKTNLATVTGSLTKGYTATFDIVASKAEVSAAGSLARPTTGGPGGPGK